MENWLWGWDFWLLIYALLGFGFTELALWSAKKFGGYNFDDHTESVKIVTYLFHFTFWPFFVLYAIFRRQKGK